MEIKNKKGSENLVADHLSRLENIPQENQIPIKEEFSAEFFLAIKELPWYADLVNFMISGVLPNGLNAQQTKKFINDAKH